MAEHAVGIRKQKLHEGDAFDTAWWHGASPGSFGLKGRHLYSLLGHLVNLSLDCFVLRQA